MLRSIRITLAAICLVLVTLLFLDFTGTVHAWFGFMAKVQLLPALLALNLGVVAALVLLTLLFGRIYCSVICPLGVMQDIFGYFGRRKKRHRYTYSPARNWLRYTVLVLFAAALAAGLASAAAIIAPYSAYGRIAQSLLSPLWGWGNNALALLAERIDSYAFYSIEVRMKGITTLATALVTLLTVGILAWRNGRTWCNTICPVGTVLGFLSRFSLLRPVIDTDKCNGCGLCARTCKAACIDSEHHTIDYSRCVTCMDCIDTCRKGAISYKLRHKREMPFPTLDHLDAEASSNSSISRRSFLTVTAALTATALARAQEKKVDGGLAAIVDKKVPRRATPIVPPGALSASHMAAHCTGCQLCVSVCPNGVLSPSGKLSTFLQPEASYERGYCRPECTKCSEVCPTGAIRPIDSAEKSSIQIGHAVWVRANCIPLTDGVACGNCARHCPTGAITMVASDPDDSESPRIPAINTERCIGCGSCEHLCPARPFSAIYVEGHEHHRRI